MRPAIKWNKRVQWRVTMRADTRQRTPQEQLRAAIMQIRKTLRIRQRELPRCTLPT